MRDYFTNSVAGAAVASPWWFPTLEELSAFSALWLPILGATWLAVQIISKLIEIYRRP